VIELQHMKFQKVGRRIGCDEKRWAIRMRSGMGTSNASRFTRGSEEMDRVLLTREARV
jgi:hypothetical protein